MDNLEEVYKQFRGDVKEVAESVSRTITPKEKGELKKLAGTSKDDVLMSILVQLCHKYIKALQRKNEIAEAAFRQWQEFDRLKGENKDLRARLDNYDEYFSVLRTQNKELRLENASLTAELKVFAEKTSEPVPVKQKHKIQRGEKIAYKQGVTPEAVLELLQQGESKVKIAEELEVNVKTVYRRIAELERKGFDVDAIIREGTLFHRFIDMIEEAQKSAVAHECEEYYSRYDECIDILGNALGLDYDVLRGMRQIKLGICTETEKELKLLRMNIVDVERYFEDEEITEDAAEREIAARQVFYNDSDAVKEESYLGRGIGQHAVPTMRNRIDLTKKFDYNAGETESFSVLEARKILEHLKRDLAGIEYNPLGINHAGAFFLANRGDAKKLKKLEETPADSSEAVSAVNTQGSELSDVPSKYEKLWLSMFKPLKATLKVSDYKVPPYREFMMPFYSGPFMEEVLTLKDGRFTCNELAWHIRGRLGVGSRWDTDCNCGLTDAMIGAALDGIDMAYTFDLTEDAPAAKEDREILVGVIRKIRHYVRRTQINNFLFDVNNIENMPDTVIKEFTRSVSSFPLYIHDLRERIAACPEIVGEDLALWQKRMDEQRIRHISDENAFIEYGNEKIEAHYLTKYEPELLALLEKSAPECAEIIKKDIQSRSGWIIIGKLCDEKHLCIVNRDAFRALENKSNQELYETETARWKQNAYSLSHLIESIISSVEALDTKAFKRLKGVEDRRPVKEQKYDALYGVVPATADFEKTIALNSDNSDQDSGPFAEISNFAIVKPFMVDTKESELLKLILSVRKNYAYDVLLENISTKELKKSSQEIFNRYHQTIKLKFLMLNIDELLALAEECGIRKEAENLKETVSDEYQAKIQIRDLILQAIKKEIETENQTASQGDSGASTGN